MTVIAADFPAARAVFAHFKEHAEANSELRAEIVEAIRALLSEYSPTVAENRFVVGGAVEHIIGAAMRSASLLARNRGHLETGSDIRVGSVGLSVKSCFQPKLSNIGLINTQGPASASAWRDATLLVLAGKGIAYVDPQLLPGAAAARQDQVLLPRRAYLGFIDSHPKFLIEADIPANPRNKATRVASYAVAEEILGRLSFQILGRYRTSMHAK